MAYEYESKETRVLKTIDSKRYPDSNKDFVKNIRRLNSSVDYMSSYMRLMQKGIDDANKNFIEQIQTFINDIVVLFAGGEPTGIDLGDLKYIFQAIGALFGFEGVFPINLINAAKHFFTAFLTPLTQFTDLIFDSIEAWMLDLIAHVKDIPVVGGALANFAQIIIDITNNAQDALDNAGEALAHAGEVTDSFLRALGLPTWSDVELWFTNLFQGFLYGIDFGNGFDLADAAIWFINVVLSPVNLLAKLVGGFIEALHIPGLDASIITSGHFAQSMILGLGEALTNLANYIGLIFDTFLNALGLPTWSDVELWFQNLFQGLFYGIDFGDGFDLLEAATWFINVVLLPVNIIAKLVGGVIEAIHIPGLDASVITSGTFAQSMIAGLGTALSNLTKFINDVIDAIEGAFRGIPVIGSGIANLIDGIQNFFNGLFGAPTPQTTVAAAAVPSIDASKVGSGTFGSGRIADGAVTAAKVADGNITAAKVADGNITNSKLGATAVTADKISDGHIINSKLGTGAVTELKIGDGAVTGAKTTTLDASKITSGSIASSIIGAGTISGSKLVNNTITASQIASATITGSNLVNDTITANQIATDTITSAEIAPSTITASELSDPLKYNVGSGSISTRVTTVTPSKLDSGTYRIGGYFNTIPADTPDITRTVLTGSPGGLVAYKVTNDGWYQVSLCYALNPQLSSGAVTNNVNWSLAPCVFTGSSAVGVTLKQVGPDFNHGVFLVSFGTAYGWGARTAQASFILYLTANTYVAPGMSVYIGGGATQQDLLSNGLGDGSDNYFSISLLNRSLA